VEISLAFQEHPDDDIWEEYAFGRLGHHQEATVEEHLLVCEHCRSTLTETDQWVRGMKAATAGFLENPPKRTWRVLEFDPGRLKPGRPAKFASAGTIALACVAALFWIGPLGSVSEAGPVTVPLQSLRAGSEAAMNHAAAKHPLDLSISLGDVPSSPEYRLEVSTFWGKAVWSGVAVKKDGALSAHVARSLGAGIYWVRLYASSELLAEYGLKLD
jgi:anti-sigma factor RsiW